jgi:hypothetical protein
MEDEVIPFQIERGMAIIRSWVDRDGACALDG